MAWRKSKGATIDVRFWLDCVRIPLSADIDIPGLFFHYVALSPFSINCRCP